MNTTLIKNILFSIALTSTAFTASADWVLNSAESTLNFISIKKLKVGEVHSFKKLQGSMTDTGNVNLTVDLASVETNIPIRNDRMQQFLFEVPKFTEATASTTVNIEKIKKIKVGQTFSETFPFKLSIHGIEKIIENEMQITKLTDNRLLVSTVSPIIINAGHYELIQGIEKLKELAKLPSISTAVPITASFIFENQ